MSWPLNRLREGALVLYLRIHESSYQLILARRVNPFFIIDINNVVVIYFYILSFIKYALFCRATKNYMKLGVESV